MRLAVGESRRVEFTLRQRAFAYWAPSGGGWTVEAGKYEILVGASSADIRQIAELTVTGPSAGTPVRANISHRAATLLIWQPPS